MTTYRILFHTDSEARRDDLSFMDVQEVGLVQINGYHFENHYKNDLLIDPDYKLSKYKFHLTPTEIACFFTHRHVWQLFAQSADPWCLIVEDDAIASIPMSEMVKQVQDLAPGWDLFCPYNHRNYIDESGKTIARQTISYEFFWGTYAYFLSKKGVAKLLEIPIMRQPLDGELYELTITGILNTSIAELSFFRLEREPASPFLVQQTQVMQEAFLTLKETGFNTWQPHQRALLRKILSVFSETAQSAGSDLILDSGTLLGHVRHGQIIPWDDDVDMAMERSEFPDFVNKIAENGLLDFGRFEWFPNQSVFHKFWDKSGEKVNNNTHTYPFVDIWLFSRMGDRIVFDDGRVFDRDMFYPLLNTEFEDFVFKIPAQPAACLDLQYDNWRKNIQICSWSHRLQHFHYPPLTIPITTDADGRLLSYK